ncbi:MULTISPECIES: hypothetical protein [unclassified Sphingopyxis]|uniref:hypothetical protein n=1 Tax=Alphaproteobacteria TaxID=28211 RepID=UPI002859983A|nr:MULTISPECIES: hypothetical protein [unclassified Sphingopyxis]MDR7060835.1 hypothetical protein [Sphingopyxis sp. BE235]MDR7181292.1 hypothetical protein [Sphingopyxis sp. BE249]
MARIDDSISAALTAAGDRPSDEAASTLKKAYSEKVSANIALALAEELRLRGLNEARPALPGELDGSGAERRMAGGIGAKKVDVTWSTEESGLILGVSIKSINFRDKTTKNYQKNLTNRRGDMLFEAVTLHRRFPYAVLGGLFIFGAGAAEDGTSKRRSTFENAHNRFRLFTGRSDPAGREEQFEAFYFMLLEASSQHADYTLYRVGDHKKQISFDELICELIQTTAIRNPDFYEYDDGQLQSMRA